MTESLPILAPDEIRALTTDLDSGTASYPSVPVHRLFEAHAEQQPGAVAARFGDRVLTYAELEERSSRLAHYLIACGVKTDAVVGVCVRPSFDALVAILAIWKAGGIYFPLDPTHPEAFVARMLDEAKPRVVLTQSELSPLTLPERYPQLCFDTDWGRVELLPATSPAVPTSLDDAAHLLYTSGTTGKPKGVVATQANLAHYIHVAQQKYRWRADDIFCSLARYTFSISLFDLVSPLCCGASVRLVVRDDVLVPDRLLRVLQEVTVVHAGPSLLGSLFRHLRANPSAPRTFPRMRHASTGGDLVPPSVMEEMTRVFENAEIFVIYGCTEISCMGTTFPVSRDTKPTRSFVGKPFPDVTLRVLDPERALVPFGEVGEICFAGKGIVRGYLDRPELTAEKFVTIEGQRFYQTGDMGRLHADGNLEILGRRDFQVQLRGIRVELAGIENTVRELGLAAQCAVVAKTLDVDDVRLVAFVVQPRDANVASFRRALSAQLPDYMLPQGVVVLDAMPLTANGKLDRHRLQELPWDSRRATTPCAVARNAIEQKIAEVFCHVLRLDEVGLDQDFFDLGGHSLLAVIAMHEIEIAVGVTFSPYVLFECPTVRGLAAHASGSPKAESRAILLNEKCAGPTLFMLSGIHIYRELAKRLQGRCSAYGVFASSELGLLDSTTTRYTVQELAREYVTIVRRAQPSGPYRLLGYSFAGSVAYEVAQQLRASGEEVRFLALLDAVIPDWVGWKFRLRQLRRLTSASPRDVLAFVGRRLRSLKSAGSTFRRYGDDERVGPLERQRDEINCRAAAQYMTEMRPFAGNVLLVASAERLRNDPLKSPSGGWSDHVPSLRMETLDADHFRFLSDDPYVSELADMLVRHMLRAERA
jgi:amino acid adenylation domain-containing protein